MLCSEQSELEGTDRIALRVAQASKKAIGSPHSAAPTDRDDYASCADAQEAAQMANCWAVDVPEVALTICKVWNELTAPFVDD